jgi:myo-inositol 2-dehydrogenase / D-chiro-inositol 1-dehydrogenase
MNAPDRNEDVADGFFRIGLIGAGRMGRTHLRAISASQRVRVAGVVDSDPGTRDLVRAAGAPAYARLDQLLDAEPLDGILVAVPTDQHLAVLEQVLACGLPVLCEKPCGVNADQADRCARAAAVAGLVLQVAYWRRFVPELISLRQRMMGGELGEILAVNCYQWDETPPSAEFRGSSGGIFIDMGVHEFDQVRWLTGQEFTGVSTARSGTGGAGAAADGDPDCAQLVARLSGGSTAVVSLGRWYPLGDSCKVEVFGTKGTVSSWFLRPGDGDAVFLAALRDQAEDFASAARSGASVGDAVAALAVAELAGSFDDSSRPVLPIVRN